MMESGHAMKDHMHMTDDKYNKDLYLTLVNPTHAMPEGWLDRVELVKTLDIENQEIWIEKETFKHFELLKQKLLDIGLVTGLESVYRSVEEQQEIVERYTEEFGEEYVKTYVAVPGYSEHHTGLAVDIGVFIDGEFINDNERMIAEEKTFAMIHSLIAEYGFILRYPKGKEEITGYGYEPWHLRYVGTDAARKIMSMGITLEEYLELIKEESDL